MPQYCTSGGDAIWHEIKEKPDPEKDKLIKAFEFLKKPLHISPENAQNRQEFLEALKIRVKKVIELVDNS